MAEGRLAPAPISNQEHYVSAPNYGADFLFEKDILIGAEDYYSLPDSLPSVRDMSSDFNQLLGDRSNSRYRMDLALEYAQHLRNRYEPGFYSYKDNRYKRTQALPRVYLDSLITTARRQKFQSIVNRVGRRFTEIEVEPLRELIGSKLDMQHDLAEYIRLNTNQQKEVAFGNLLVVMLHTRRLLYGDEVTEEKDLSESKHQLAAVLAEHKVLTALQRKWPQATFGSVDQDRAGTDVVVPRVPDSPVGVALQVKSSLNPDWNLRILRRESDVPRVQVPMNPRLHHPFRLSADQAHKLLNFVEFAPRRPLQTGVDTVELAA